MCIYIYTHYVHVYCLHTLIIYIYTLKYIYVYNCLFIYLFVYIILYIHVIYINYTYNTTNIIPRSKSHRDGNNSCPISADDS